MDPRIQELPRNRLKVKPKFPLVCPCGCSLQQSNEMGYCKHLVGFTLDRKVVEVREVVGVSDTDPHGRYERTGVQKRPLDLEKDILVEMETPTCRVYQTFGDPLVNRNAQASEVEELRSLVQQQGAMIRELQEALTGSDAPALKAV